jgi:hypothetical protein
MISCRRIALIGASLVLCAAAAASSSVQSSTWALSEEEPSARRSTSTIRPWPSATAQRGQVFELRGTAFGLAGTVTRRLVATGELLGIDGCDHIVVGDGRYYNFKEGSQMSTRRL